jgi:hypothetical protein
MEPVASKARQSHEVPQRVTLSPQWKNLQTLARVLILDTSDFCVVLDDELDVDWETTPAYDAVRDSMGLSYGLLFNRISALQAIPIRHLSRDLKLAYRRMIGEATARGLEGDTNSGSAILDVAEEFIRARNAELARRWYLFGSFAAAAVAIILATLAWFCCRNRTPPSDVAGDILAVGFGGALGAMLSILLRVGNAPLDPAAGPQLHYIEAAARILTGVIGATVVLAAIKANLLLPHLRDPYGLLLACLAGGAVERLGWTLIDKVRVLSTEGSEAQTSANGSKNQPNQQDQAERPS